MESQGKALQERFIDFAVLIIHVSNQLPKTPAGRHIANQILRSGTSPAPNYGEARSAESRADFIHKFRIVAKELNETRIWLEIIDRSHLLDKSQIASAMSENDQLCRITHASLRTLRARAGDESDAGFVQEPELDYACGEIIKSKIVNRKS